MGRICKCGSKRRSLFDLFTYVCHNLLIMLKNNSHSHLRLVPDQPEAESNGGRQLSGPPRMVGDRLYTGEELANKTNMLMGKSRADRMTRAYGSRGEGWDFETLPLKEGDSINLLARAAIRKARQNSEPGNTGQTEVGYVVVYPDGDLNYAQKSRG